MHCLRSRLAPHSTRRGLALGASSALLVLVAMGCGSEPLEGLDTPLVPDLCQDLDRLACHADASCEARYTPGAPCADGMCYSVDFVECVEPPTDRSHCSLDMTFCTAQVCAFGRALDSMGCPTCACLPPTIPCAQMNHDQCLQAFECRPKYVSDGGAIPCPGDDPSCGRAPTFAGCEKIPADQCQTHSDCNAGFCVPGSRTTASTCVLPQCSDGSTLVCALDKPRCERGFVAAIIEGCWACVDEITCGKSKCDEPKDVERTYSSRDVNDCARILLDCGANSEPFNDECGCGCEVRLGAPRCPPESEDRTYISQSPQQCAVINYSCPADWEAFNNECGCGCRYAPAPPPLPPPTQVVVDCGQGTRADCDALPPRCAADRVLTVRNGCWACVTSEQCREGV